MHLRRTRWAWGRVRAVCEWSGKRTREGGKCFAVYISTNYAFRGPGTLVGGESEPGAGGSGSGGAGLDGRPARDSRCPQPQPQTGWHGMVGLPIVCANADARYDDIGKKLLFQTGDMILASRVVPRYRVAADSKNFPEPLTRGAQHLTRYCMTSKAFVRTLQPSQHFSMRLS